MTTDDYLNACREQALRREGWMAHDTRLPEDCRKYALMMFPDPPKPTKRREVYYGESSYRLSEGGMGIETCGSDKRWFRHSDVAFIYICYDLLQHPDEEAP